MKELITKLKKNNEEMKEIVTNMKQLSFNSHETAKPEYPKERNDKMQTVKVNGIEVKVEGENLFFKFSLLARGLQFTVTGTDCRQYVKWNTVKDYLVELRCISKNDRDKYFAEDFVPESWLYALATKADNEYAPEFLKFMCMRVIPKVRELIYSGFNFDNLKVTLIN